MLGNIPDWDISARLLIIMVLFVLEDSADTLGGTLRGTPTGNRT